VARITLTVCQRVAARQRGRVVVAVEALGRVEGWVVLALGTRIAHGTPRLLLEEARLTRGTPHLQQSWREARVARAGAEDSAVARRERVRRAGKAIGQAVAHSVFVRARPTRGAVGKGARETVALVA